MQNFKPGTKVRVRSHPEVVGTVADFKPKDGCHWVMFPWTDITSRITDDNLEVVPPEPFDSTTLLESDVLETPDGRYAVVQPRRSIQLPIFAVWRHKPNPDGSRGDYVLIYDAEQGGTK